MTEQELRGQLDELRSLPHETEWVEFKCNNRNPQEIGEYLSALSNAAKLHYRQYAYLVFGIENETHKVVGTRFKPRQAKKGNEPLEAWLARLLDPRIDFRIHEFQYKEEMAVVIFEIDAARSKPVKFSGTEYIRVGESKRKLSDFPEKERRLWQNLSGHDWTAEICEGVGVDALEPVAIKKARELFAQRHPQLAEESKSWDNLTFLNKAKLSRQGKLTRTAIILLGTEEALSHLPSRPPLVSWILRDEHGMEKTYEHFSAPLILTTDEIFAKIRNITIRYLPDGTLFPKEVSQYDPWVIREALHNAIAHQDYDMRGRISIVEKPDELVITNVGDFIPGSVEEVIRQDAPQSYYRNPFLSGAMVNLKMIETIGSGIKEMYNRQRNRFLPMPDYDFSRSGEVKVIIPGRILDKNYTQMLITKTELSLFTVILLDKVQKKITIAREEAESLRKQGLIEGRYPNIFIASHVASIAGQKATYIKQRGLNDSYYIEMVMEYLRKYGSASRKDIDELLLGKLPEVLRPEQKENKIGWLLSNIMAKKRNLIRNIGARRTPEWVINAEETGINKKEEDE